MWLSVVEAVIIVVDEAHPLDDGGVVVPVSRSLEEPLALRDIRLAREIGIAHGVEVEDRSRVDRV